MDEQNNNEHYDQESFSNDDIYEEEQLDVLDENIVDEDFDSKAWEEEYVESFPSLLKMLILFGLLFVAGLLVYQYLQSLQAENTNASSVVASMSVSEKPALDVGTAEPLQAQPEIKNAADSKSMTKLEASTVDVETKQDIDQFLSQESVMIGNRQTTQGYIKGSKEVTKTLEENKQAAAKPAINKVVSKVADVKNSKSQTASNASTLKKTSNNIMKASSAPMPAKPISSNAVKGHAQIKALSSSHYAVQLIGMNDTAGFKRFVSDLPAGINNVYTYQRVRQGKTWNVAILAPYPSSVAAKQAIDQLPSSLKSHQPWVKSLKTVQLQLN